MVYGPDVERIPQRFALQREDARLSVADFGGDGPTALILHGLYGGAHEWAHIATFLKHSYHVVALDQRGHGNSAKGLSDFSIDALAADAAAVLEYLGCRPALVIGQSMGAVVAILLAARRPELVQRLVLIECHAASEPSQSTGNDWLAQWPLPFKDLAAARAFFKSQRMDPAVWTQVLEHRNDGFWPVFRTEDMKAISEQLSSYDYRAECATISAPALVIAGSESWLNVVGVRQVADLIPSANFAEIRGAGHDVHLDAPQALKAALEDFVTIQ